MNSKIVKYIIMSMIFSTTLFASTRGDVKVIEASENIRLYGQRIAKDYLYYYKNSKKLDLKEKLDEDVKSIEKSIIDIATITKNSDSKNILDFLAYNKDEIKELLNQNVSKEKSILMLDYGESFLEGANSIAVAHYYDFSLEEKMLMLLKDIEYLLERTTKYYVASALDLDKKNNFNNMKQAIVGVDDILKQINTYSYPVELSADIESLNSIWSRHKVFLYKSEKLTVPNLLLSSESLLEDLVSKIALHHKQNL